MIDQSTLHFICQHANDELQLLALQGKRHPNINLPFVIEQLKGRRIAADKIPSWAVVDGIIYPPQLSLEQCSSEITAKYKSTLLAGESFVDLTGGMGVDCFFLAHHFKRAQYVEQQSNLCQLAAHNFAKLGQSQIEVINQSASSFLETMQLVDCIYLDPARRNDRGEKVFLLSDCTPDVSQLAVELVKKAKTVLIKLSPMLDLTLALQSLPQAIGVHIVSFRNECKELLILLSQESSKSKRVAFSELPITCIDVRHSDFQFFTFTRKEEQEAVCEYTSEVGSYLYEPHSSIMKGGGFNVLAVRLGILKLHANSHLYSSDRFIPNFPGRCFMVTNHYSLNKQELKKGLSGLKQANITVRNFPASVVDLRKRTKLQEGGEVYLFATTLANEKHVLIECRKSVN